MDHRLNRLRKGVEARSSQMLGHEALLFCYGMAPQALPVRRAPNPCRVAYSRYHHEIGCIVLPLMLG